MITSTRFQIGSLDDLFSKNCPSPAIQIRLEIFTLALIRFDVVRHLTLTSNHKKSNEAGRTSLGHWAFLFGFFKEFFKNESKRQT